tara:strand:- start:57 stop:404 length:348 start_codon:yes stop_codon:yes gene_type:complete
MPLPNRSLEIPKTPRNLNALSGTLAFEREWALLPETDKGAAPMNLLTVKETLAKTGYRSRNTLAAKVRNEGFPPPVQVGSNRLGFDAGEVDAWLASRPRGFLCPVGCNTPEHQAA